MNHQVKKDIVQRMGGSSQYSMAIFEWSMLLIKDPVLEHIYRNVNFNQLVRYKEMFLIWPLVKQKERRKTIRHNES